MNAGSAPPDNGSRTAADISAIAWNCRRSRAIAWHANWWLSAKRIHSPC